MRQMVEDTMLRAHEGLTQIDLRGISARRGIVPTLGLSLAAVTSLVLWLALVEAARWAAKILF